MKTLGILAILLGFGTLTSDEFVPQKFRMDGKYGLYAKLDGQKWTISWFTPVAEANEVIALKDEVEEKIGETNSSTIHRYELEADDKIEYLKFGGPQSGFHKLQLRTEIERAPFDLQEVDSIYVFGDTHGNFDYVVDLLKGQNLINDKSEWTGGNTHLVFVGDILDRGKDALRLAWFIHDLEESAKAKGGMVHLVLGNHEIMVMSGDIRYVSPKEKQLASLHGVDYSELFHPKETLIGRWLSSKPAVLKVDGAIFTHGGLILEAGIQEVNDQAYELLQKDAFTYLKVDNPDFELIDQEEFTEVDNFFYDPYSPFWYRGYVKYDTVGAYLDYILTKNKGRLHVVGHTSRPNIEERYKGKLIATNVHEAGSELLLLVRKKKKYSRFKIDLEGNLEEL